MMWCYIGLTVQEGGRVVGFFFLSPTWVVSPLCRLKYHMWCDVVIEYYDNTL